MRLVTYQILEPELDLLLLRQEVGQEIHHLQNVGVVIGYLVTYKHPQRLLDVELTELLTLRLPQPLLLVEGQ
ncbi:hypothetical protein D3C76_1452950 [compost metagenome]